MSPWVWASWARIAGPPQLGLVVWWDSDHELFLKKKMSNIFVKRLKNSLFREKKSVYGTTDEAGVLALRDVPFHPTVEGTLVWIIAVIQRTPRVHCHFSSTSSPALLLLPLGYCFLSNVAHICVLPSPLTARMLGHWHWASLLAAPSPLPVFSIINWR